MPAQGVVSSLDELPFPKIKGRAQLLWGEADLLTQLVPPAVIRGMKEESLIRAQSGSAMYLVSSQLPPPLDAPQVILDNRENGGNGERDGAHQWARFDVLFSPNKWPHPAT